MSKYVAIGDIHGCLNELNEMLDVLDKQFPEHVRIFLGDYIDRGPNSKGVIDKLIAYNMRQECVFLRGNHEDMFMEAMRERSSGHLQYYPECYESYGLDYTTVGYDYLPAGHWKFLTNTRQYYETRKHFFVHAGVNPSYSLNDQNWNDSLWIRDRFLDHTHSFGKMVVHGHTPQDAITWKKNRINLDTSCVFGGRLTALVIDEEFELMMYNTVQIDSKFNFMDRYKREEWMS